MPIQRKYDFKPGTKISSGQVDEEFDQVISQLNQIEFDDKTKDADLRNKAQLRKITTDDGGVSVYVNQTTDDVLQRILSKGMGLHTFYAVAGSKNLPPSNISIRGVAQLTNVNFGWVWCIDYKNQMWTNYLDNNVWLGWKKLSSQTSEADQGRLWTGVVYPDQNQTIRPTKKLSECRTGWILVWSDYDFSVGANDYQWAVSYVPKSFLDYARGRGIYLPVMNSLTENEVLVTGKYITINDDSLVGQDLNSKAANNANDVCLRYVYEF